MAATKMSTPAPAPVSPSKPARLRSPAYPGIDLEAAIKRAQELYDHERRSAASAEVVVQHWGFKPTSGGGYVVIAALKAFGLIFDSGSGKERKIQLSDLALRILLDRRPDSPDRQEAIKQAALMPKIHASLWQRYGAETPSDANLAHELVFERRFNENSVKDFIKEYRDTIKFAKLSGSDTLSSPDEDTEGADNMTTDAQIAEKPAFAGKSIQPPTAKEISLPVGMSEEGNAIFAHVRFDAPLKKEMLVSLKQLLDVLEKTLN